MLLLLATTVLLVLGAAANHLQALVLLTAGLRRVRKARLWVGVAVILSIVAHVVEISLFALGYRLIASEHTGRLVNGQGEVSEDYFFYFSFTAYTTLGLATLCRKARCGF